MSTFPIMNNIAITKARNIGDIKALLKANPCYFNDDRNAWAFAEKLKRSREQARGRSDMSVYTTDFFDKTPFDPEFIHMVLTHSDPQALMSHTYRDNEFPALYHMIEQYVLFVWDTVGFDDNRGDDLLPPGINAESGIPYIFCNKTNTLAIADMVEEYLNRPGKRPNALKGYITLVFNTLVPAEDTYDKVDDVYKVILNLPNGFNDVLDSQMITDDTRQKLCDAYGIDEASEIITALNIMRDVAIHPSAGRDLFIRCCQWYNNTYYLNELYEVADRYARYFKDPESAIIAVMDIASYADLAVNHKPKYGPVYSGQEEFKNHIFRVCTSLIQSFNDAGKDAAVMTGILRDTVRVTGYDTALGPMNRYADMWDQQPPNAPTTESFSNMTFYDTCAIAYETTGNDSENDYDSGIHENAKVRKTTKPVQNMTNKIYRGYQNYKNAEQNVDSQITKCLTALKTAIQGGDARTQIIEGRKFSAIGLLKKLLGTVAIFSYNKIAGVIFLVVRHTLRKQATESEKQKVLSELRQELEIVEEKIQDARGDENREAKYALMRTRGELQDAIRRIEYGIGAAGSKKIKVTPKTGLKVR